MGTLSHDAAVHGLELLAPAGSFDALRAAVRNGADAVYLGLADMNARRGAENFTYETLAEACRYAHLRNSRIYLTANIVVLESEMSHALQMIARAWEAGIDAVIVQGLGLLAALRGSLPEVRVHASTQIDTHNMATVRVLEQLGVSRVTLARELAVDEIAVLTAASNLELESFVHGSLCFCHSGQCLMSSLIGGRSANRGLCAQPCRLPYDLVGPDGVAEVPGRYLLSPKDLCGIELLPQLLRSGVAALKIEGRMKSPEYVASVVSTYRAAIDRVLASAETYAVRPSETATLEEAFNRGFTPGYLADVRDDRLMSYQRPNNRGVAIGRVVATTAGHATISLDRALEAADTVEFWTGAGRFAQTAGPMLVPGGRANAAPAGARVQIATEKPARAGDRVFRVMNAALTEAARRSWQSAEEKRSLPVHMRVRLRIGEPALVEVTAFGTIAKASGPVVETARTKAITADEVVEHVSRLGGTPYSVSGVTVQLDAIAGIGFSVLHQLRREALEKLEEQRLAPWITRPRLAEFPVPPALEPSPALPAAGSKRRRRSVELVCAVADARVASACQQAGADSVVLATSFGGRAPDGVGVLLPRVAHEGEVAGLVEVAMASGGPVIAGNLGVVAAAAEAGVGVQADWGLNVVNPWSAAVLAEIGAGAVWASPELSGRQIAAIVSRSPLPVGVVVGGRLELMIAEHCVLQAAGECDHVCRACARRRKSWVLRDRKGYDMPVTTDADGRAHIYNAVPLDLARALPEIVAAGVSAIRLELQSSTPEEAAELVAAWRERLELAVDERLQPDVPIVEPSTSGHFFRGIR